MRKEEREKIRTGEKDILHPAFTESPGEIIGEPERISGAEILPESVEFEGLPPDIKEACDNAIQDFCLYENTPPIDDMSKARQPRWTAACMYVGYKVFKKRKLLRRGEGERRENGTLKPYDYNVLYAAIPLWLYFCVKYDKAPFISDFGHFCGCSFDWIYCKDSELLTPTQMRLTKKLHEIQEGGLAAIISDGSKNPTGAIAILNHWHGWSNNINVTTTDTKTAITAQNLPKLGN